MFGKRLEGCGEVLVGMGGFPQFVIGFGSDRSAQVVEYCGWALRGADLCLEVPDLCLVVGVARRRSESIGRAGVCCLLSLSLSGVRLCRLFAIGSGML